MVGQRLREARLARRMLLSHVATKANMSTATLSRIETGKQSVGTDVLLTLAEVLDVRAHELLDDKAPEDGADALGRRIAALGPQQRAKLWRDLAAAQRNTRPRRGGSRSLGHEIDEIVAQVDFLREEIESIRARVKKRG